MHKLEPSSVRLNLHSNLCETNKWNILQLKQGCFPVLTLIVTVLHDGIVSMLSYNLNICGSFVLGSTPSYKRQFLPLRKYRGLQLKKKKYADWFSPMPCYVAMIVLWGLLPSWPICWARVFISCFSISFGLLTLHPLLYTCPWLKLDQ